MKVRWMHGSLRVRVSPTECAQLLAGIPIVETSGFPGDWLVTVCAGSNNALHAEKPGAITLVFDTNDLQTLSDPSAEGIYPTIDGIKIILEKDFPCVHPRPSQAAENTKTFPAPPGFAERKA